MILKNANTNLCTNDAESFRRKSQELRGLLFLHSVLYDTFHVHENGRKHNEEQTIQDIVDPQLYKEWGRSLLFQPI